jgi:hypothetical protein
MKNPSLSAGAKVSLRPAGRLVVIVSSGSGAVRGLKYPNGRSREGGCGSTTDRAFGYDRSIVIMSGAKTLSRRRPMMVESSGS